MQRDRIRYPLGLVLLLVGWSWFMTSHVALAADPVRSLIREENQQPGFHRLAIDARPRRWQRFSLALDRRLLLEAKRAGRRVDRHHGLDQSAATASRSRSSAWAITAVAGARLMTKLGPFAGQDSAHAAARPERTSTNAGGSRRRS